MTNRAARLLAAACIGAYLLVGCSVGGPSRQAPAPGNETAVAQAVADAQAGLDAFAKAPGVAFGPDAAKMLEGAKEYNLSAAGKSVIPPPRMDPGAILADPSGYHAAAVTAREKADGSWLRVMAFGGGLLALEALAAIGKLVPGPIGAGLGVASQMFANFRWKFQSTAEAKESDNAAATLAGHAQTIAVAVNTLAPDVLAKLDPRAAAALQAVLAKAPPPQSPAVP